MLDSEGLQPPSDVDTLSRILSRTASLLQARGCGVFTWDRDKNVLGAMRPFAGLDEAKIKSLEFPVGGSALGVVVLQDRPVLLETLDGDSRDLEVLKELGFQNVVAVPLALEQRDENNEIVRRSIMGIFCAFEKFYGRSFDMEDARLLSMMARQASAVLVTSQFYWKEIERSKGYEQLIESASVGLMAVSQRGTVTQVNASARKALNIDSETWFGRPYDELIQSREIRYLVEDALGGNPPEEPKEMTLMIKNAEGEPEEGIFRVQIDQIRSEDGQGMGWVTVFENVTDIRQAERMMSVFVDMVSHELRTPLTSIRGFVATLLQAGEGMFDWATQEEFLQIVDTEAERLGQMIDDLLNIARIQNGRGLQFNFIPTDIRNITQHVVRLLSQSSFMKGNHRLLTDIAEDVQSFLADDAKLQQILYNLVGNALKYSPNGGDVTIGARLQEIEGVPGVTLFIKDSGLGIPKEQLPKMFTQFYRVDSSTHTGIKGTGLGLWLTKHMVEGHAGKLWVESEFGHGSTFFVWLPINPNDVLRSDEG